MTLRQSYDKLAARNSDLEETIRQNNLTLERMQIRYNELKKEIENKNSDRVYIEAYKDGFKDAVRTLGLNQD